MNIPKVDMFEGSVPTAPADVRIGDWIATSWHTADKVVDVLPTPSGAYLYLTGVSGPYKIHRKSTVPVVKR